MARDSKKLDTPNDTGAREVVVAEQTQVATLHAPRLPYSKYLQDNFGVDQIQWRAIVESIYPNAKTIDSVVLVLSYCKARSLDVMKKPVHIVPMYSSAAGGTVDTVWPGISEIRTTATRGKDVTGGATYAGCDEAAFGPDLEQEFEGEEAQWENGRKTGTKKVKKKVVFPEWCQFTVYKMVQGQRVKFVGPKVYWLETYATQNRYSSVPNEMWSDRAYGQIEKCAEAAALRRAFPEEVGNDYAAEEMEGKPLYQALPANQQIAKPADKDDGPPNPNDPAKREIVTVEDKSVTRDGEVIDADYDDGPPRTSHQQDNDDAETMDDGDDTMDGEEDTRQRVEPSAISCPKGTKKGEWTDQFIKNLVTSETPADVHKWIELNRKLVTVAETDASCKADIAKAMQETMKRLGGKAKPTATVADGRTASSGKAKPGKNEAVVKLGDPPVDPEDWIKWCEEMLATVTDPNDLQEFWDKNIAPSFDELPFPGDKTKAAALYDLAEKRLGID